MLYLFDKAGVNPSLRPVTISNSGEQRRRWSNLVKDPLNLIFLRCVILSYQVSQLNCELEFVDIICRVGIGII